VSFFQKTSLNILNCGQKFSKFDILIKKAGSYRYYSKAMKFSCCLINIGCCRATKTETTAKLHKVMLCFQHLQGFLK